MKVKFFKYVYYVWISHAGIVTRLRGNDNL